MIYLSLKGKSGLINVVGIGFFCIWIDSFSQVASQMRENHMPAE